MAFCCPKSIRACALRLTRLNASGVPVDPVQPNSRIQTSGFMELNLTPRYESGDSEVTRDPGGNVRIVDTDFDQLLGMEVRLRLCGVNPTVLEMLTGLDILSDTAYVLNDSRRFACLDPVMVEVWSKNVAADCGPAGPLPGSGLWVHWVLPRTNLWTLNGDIKFSSGVLEVSLSGYATPNEGFFPSYPDPANNFPSYVAGWPTGPAPTTIPLEVVPDAWTVTEAQGVRNGGPLGWKCVDALPAPLSDCDYVPAGCVEPDEGYEQSFVAPLGEPPSPPWRVPDPFVGGGVLPQFTDEGVVATEQFQIGVVETTDFELACVCEGNTPAIVTEGVLWQGAPGADVIVPPILAEWTTSGADVGTMFLNAAYSGGAWYLGLSISDWTTPDGITPIFQSQQTSYALTSPVVPQDGDLYRLEAFYDPLNFTVGGAIILRLFVNDVEVGDVAWAGVNTVSSGFGHLFDTYAPPCEPVGAFGSPVNSAVPYFFTITDLGGGVYNVLADDPNQSGTISDPAGPLNNSGGASTLCLPGSTGAPCATDPDTPPTQQTYNDGTSDYTVVVWPSLITAVTDYAASGNGWKVGVTYDLSDQALALNADSTAGIIFGAAFRNTLATLVALHGSGVPFPVTSPIVGGAAVTCLNNLYPLGAPPPPPILTDWGFFVVPTPFTPVPMSSVTKFAIRCAPAGSGAPVVYPTWTLVT